MTGKSNLIAIDSSMPSLPPQDELEKSHTLLSNFSRFLPGMFFQFQRYSEHQFSFKYVSAAVEQLFEITAEQLINDASILYRKIHPDDLAYLIIGIRRSAAELTIWHHEYRVLRTDGGERWLAGDATPEKQADGSVLWHGFISDNTERKLTEQKLLAAEQQMRLVMKASNQGLYDINLQSGKSTFSPEYLQMLGYSAEDFPDSSQFWNYFWSDGVHKDDVANLRKAYQKHFASRGTIDYHAEFRQKNKAGEWRWIMSIGAVVEWDTNQRAVRMVGTHIDITERKRIEEELMLNQELLNASKNRYKELARELEILIANAPVGIMFVSNDVIVRANQALAELCRFPDAQSMIGVKTSFLYQHLDDYEAFGDAVIPKLLADELVEIEWRLHRNNGEAFFARVAGRALSSETYHKGTVWMIEDITEQRRTLDALRDSEGRLQRLMNSSLIGIVHGNQRKRLLDVNQVFCQLCGYTREQIIGESYFWRELMSESDQYICMQAYNELQTTGTTSSFEIMLRHADGRSIPVLVGVNHLENSQQEWVAFTMDISDRLRMHQLKTEFISVVSHELRTPLTSIRGSLGLLESGVAGTLSDAAQQLVRIANANSKRLIGLVNDILDMDKLANGKMSIKSEPVDLVALLYQAIEANTAYATNLHVSLVADVRLIPDSTTDTPHAWCLGDSDRLMQVITNLISNAAKFSPEDAEVNIRLFQSNHVYRMEICDHGPGIPLEFQAHIFEPFTQADSTNTRQQGGTGLGLSIAKTLIEKMRGEIFFVSCPEHGTTFWFDLPIYDPVKSA
ncbi:PAS domain-containing sensor histidine kinase [Undibacterium jejuense]|uniref:histidine kinase n=1 Tax=Undibacterium jejuense TaxID=1344949 RepID=A0A923HJM2_9BURK|nr:PAS domain-containing sensor histidine kinase [Undibacterium jejuense]MBC3862024.1 PAS domain-containing sensor histidine kinase [Undibacterium jejuense]